VADIVLDHVSKTFPDGTVAVREINLTIADGELVILVGPSGCGKTTVLNLIAGLEEIGTGELRIGGRRMNERKPRERDVAMVFQSYALYPHMTVRENLAFPLRLARLDTGTIERKVTETARILELTRWLDRKPAHLSGGQRQRVAMGRAIVRSPQAFLMDEPLSNLDATLRVQMRAEISRLQRQLGTTTVYVTHDQTEAMTLGDRVVVMRAGVVQQGGEPQELYERPANTFVAGFIGSPPMNLLDATVVDGRLHTALGNVPIGHEHASAIEAAGGADRLVLGIRPESFEDAGPADAAVRSEGAVFEAPVDLVESPGAEKYVHLALDERGLTEGVMGGTVVGSAAAGLTAFRTLVARLPNESAVRAGVRWRVRHDPAKIHLFDAESGRRIPAPD